MSKLNKKRVSPFSCGSEAADWHAWNCGNCHKGYDRTAEAWRCELEQALDYAAMDNGTIPRAIAERIGIHPHGINGWCGEQDPIYTVESWAARHAPTPRVLRPLWWRLREAIRITFKHWVPPWDRDDYEEWSSLRDIRVAWHTAWIICGDAQVVKPGWVRPELVLAKKGEEK